MHEFREQQNIRRLEINRAGTGNCTDYKIATELIESCLQSIVYGTPFKYSVQNHGKEIRIYYDSPYHLSNGEEITMHTQFVPKMIIRVSEHLTDNKVGDLIFYGTIFNEHQKLLMMKKVATVDEEDHTKCVTIENFPENPGSLGITYGLSQKMFTLCRSHLAEFARSMCAAYHEAGGNLLTLQDCLSYILRFYLECN